MFSGLRSSLCDRYPVLQIIDKVGRRRSLMCSSGGCSASLLVLGTLLATGATENKARGGAAASMTFICTVHHVLSAY